MDMQDKYDPMTGELLSEKTTDDNTEWQFDPMTGELLSEKKTENDSEWQFDPMTGKPVKKKKGKILIIAAAVIVLAVVAFAGIKSGLFLSNGSKVLRAVKNTVDMDTHLADALEKLSILRSDNYTVDYRMEIDEEDIDMDIEYANSPQKKWMSGNVRYEYLRFSFMAELTSSQLRVKLPDLSERVFTYNFQEKKTGFITKYVDSDVLESIDNTLNTLASKKEQTTLEKDIYDIFRDQYRSLRFETVDKKEFKINGKNRKCKGYSTTITSDDAVDVLRGIRDVCKDEYSYLLDAMDYTDLINEFRDMPDIEVTFYLYKNRIACINLETDNLYMRVLVDGDGKKEQSIRVIADGEDVLELKKTEKNTEERYSLSIEDTEVLKIRYNYKSGDYILEMYDSYEGTMTMEGSLISDSSGLEVSVGEISTRWETFDPGIYLSIRRGSTVGELDGEEFDIGDATEKEFMDELKDLYDYFTWDGKHEPASVAVHEFDQ